MSFSLSFKGKKKYQRRSVARLLRATKLPLPIRCRIAKAIVNGDELASALKKLGAKITYFAGCECCSEDYIKTWNYNGIVFHTLWNKFDV